MERILILAAIILAAILFPQTALLVIGYLASCFEALIKVGIGLGCICAVYMLVYLRWIMMRRDDKHCRRKTH